MSDLREALVALCGVWLEAARLHRENANEWRKRSTPEHPHALSVVQREAMADAYVAAAADLRAALAAPDEGRLDPQSYGRGVEDGYAAARRPCRHGTPRALCIIACGRCGHGCIAHYYDGHICTAAACGCEWLEAAPASPEPRPTGGDYDHSIHDNPSAAAWASFFSSRFPAGGPCPDEGTMLGWFANAMMAMSDHLGRRAASPEPREDPLVEARRICAEQAEDEGLWFIAERVTEANLQKALRRLTTAVERAASPDPEGTRCPACEYERRGVTARVMPAHTCPPAAPPSPAPRHDWESTDALTNPRCRVCGFTMLEIANQNRADPLVCRAPASPSEHGAPKEEG